MFLVDRIDTYRDGGTICVKCRMAISWREVAWLEGKDKNEIEICVDGRIGQKPMLWFGYPGAEGSEPIEDEDIIDYVIKKMAEHRDRQAYKMNRVIGLRENLRDWKIQNILE